ncbi:MAG: tetratricopeptide repeat protein [Parvibaculum sp.]|uniref:putative 2OG-Fe(II) oxygenase n=1 Tax=Parvibaculum sp. TaxID=2024848 RepID=UPI0025E01271|nr:putative 2OG-Fe(II) oxygenase [Parvibaculum sp.]MCE9649519.1 tetratricopeptide repeat protein [Parvibaculum sp.]
MSDQMQSTPDLMKRRADILELYKAKKRGQTEAACRALLEEFPDDAETLSILAAALIDRQAFAEAETALRRAHELAPHSPLPWTNLGRFFQQHGRWGEALTHYTLAAAKFPGNPIFSATLGQICQRAGDFAGAERAFRAASRLQPQNAGMLVNIGMVVLRQDRVDEAVELFKRAIVINPQLAAAYGNLGNAEQKRGDLAAAEAAYEKASTLDPKDVLTYVSAGLMKLRRGDAREAAEIFDRAIARHGPERRAAAWFPYARAQELGHMPAGFRAELARIVSRKTLTPPPGYSSMAELNAALADALRADPTLTWEPVGKATRKGGQTGLLLDQPREPFLAFEIALRKAIDAHFSSIKVEKKHPYFGYVPETYQLDMWGTLLSDGGHQHPHIHVGGWMSGVYYVALPPSMGKGEARDGWIEFGSPPPDFNADFEPQTLAYEPKEGDAFFFPSYAFHRTLPFTGDTQRISLAFDVKPTSWRK